MVEQTFRAERVLYDLNDLLFERRDKDPSKALYVDEPLTNDFLERLRGIVMQPIVRADFEDCMDEALGGSPAMADWQVLRASQIDRARQSRNNHAEPFRFEALARKLSPEYRLYLSPYRPSTEETLGLTTVSGGTDAKVTLISGIPHHLWRWLVKDLDLKYKSIWEKLDPDFSIVLRPDPQQSSIFFKTAACALLGLFESVHHRENDLVVARNIAGTCEYIAEQTGKPCNVRVHLPFTQDQATAQPHVDGFPIPSHLSTYMRDNLVFDSSPFGMSRYIAERKR